MKRQLEDATDRAHSKRRIELVRLPLHQLGFHPRNRGGLGVCAHHAHEVGHDGVSNTIKLSRYDYVNVLEVPTDKQLNIRDVNAKKCSQASPSLAPASTGILYVTLTKTHFVHACKLALLGTGTLFDKHHEIPFFWKRVGGDQTAWDLVCHLRQGPLLGFTRGRQPHAGRQFELGHCDERG